MSEPMTVDDVDQIAEGIWEFIIAGNPELEVIWQPYLDKLAALQAPLRQAGWQPIETAPREQRVLVVLKPQPSERVGEITFAYFVMTLPDEPEGVWTRDETGEACVPTHWMPVPDAPTLAEGDNEPADHPSDVRGGQR